jgi:GNAT superfamily N-acetyltransferase
VIRELQPAETHLAYSAMLELRPHLGGVDDFVARVNDVQRAEGYRLVASFTDDDEVAAVAGFRITNHLAWGRTLYCDDLSTHPEHRRRGHAGRLIDWMVDEAVRSGCDEFHLDSGVGPDRTAAHALYFSKGMRISAYHFLRRLEENA